MFLIRIPRESNQSRAFRKAREKLRKIVRELKSQPCTDCGKKFPPEAMDFDHVPGRGGKLGSVGSRKSARAILIEAAKCDVVCAICHRVRTEKRRRGVVSVVGLS